MNEQHLSSNGQIKDELDIDMGGGRKLRDVSALEFIQWALKKINDSGVNNNQTKELNMMAGYYPGRLMPDDQKQNILNKMKTAGIKLE